MLCMRCLLVGRVRGRERSAWRRWADGWTSVGGPSASAGSPTRRPAHTLNAGILRVRVERAGWSARWRGRRRPSGTGTKTVSGRMRVGEPGAEHAPRPRRVRQLAPGRRRRCRAARPGRGAARRTGSGAAAASAATRRVWVPRWYCAQHPAGGQHVAGSRASGVSAGAPVLDARGTGPGRPGWRSASGNSRGVPGWSRRGHGQKTPVARRRSARR